MASMGLIIPRKIAAQDVKAWVRSGVSDAVMENGMVGVANTLSTTTGEDEVFSFVTPTTGNLSNLWMVYEPEVVVTDSSYRGINPDPRDFSLAIGDVFSIFQPQIGDIISMSADAISGTQSTNTFVVATNATDTLVWSAAAVSGLSLKLIDDADYVSIADGSIGGQRVALDRFIVVAVA